MAAKPVNTVRKEEIAKFAAASQEWWDQNGQFGLLHKMNPVRIQYIREMVAKNLLPHRSSDNMTDNERDLGSLSPTPFDGLRMLDVGCGGGLLSESLARLGGTIVGADAAEENIAMAKWHASKDFGLSRGPGSIDYRATTAEKLVDDNEQFDVVIASEVIEHVADQPAFVNACSQLLKTGGILIFSTINRTIASYLLTIVAAERILGIVPPGTHTHNQYVTPEELETWVQTSGSEVLDTTGIWLDPLRQKWGLFDHIPGGVLSKQGGSKLNVGLQMNYITAARKK